MALAFPQIKHFRAVKLTDYVKKPQKAKWESLLYRKCAGQADEFDHVAAVQDILATHPSELPPNCVCRKSCHVYYMDRKHRDLGAPNKWIGGSTFDFEDGSEEGEVDDTFCESPILATESGGTSLS
ncbi:hypothetical protein B5807_09893 [Epicoccum nigrum]|uniref:Uncharacterized protein n=1 Tax=Epicoccum nigrum TaxID=105696 RepID=A0A1Y2LT34_EPING|nr:hypothetical protein B5807_09893 [Epicoccum nigrum]